MPAADRQLDLLDPPAPAVAVHVVAPRRPRWHKPRVSKAAVAALEAKLRGKGWQTRAELGLDERTLRLLAEASNGAVLSSPGSAGYRHFDDAEDDEWDRADAAITSQINSMVRRRRAYRQRRARIERSRRSCNNDVSEPRRQK